MRDPNRIVYILRTLEYLWQKYPDQRLGQLLSNYGFERGTTITDDWYNWRSQEDDVTLANLLAALKEESE